MGKFRALRISRAGILILLVSLAAVLDLSVTRTRSDSWSVLGLAVAVVAFLLYIVYPRFGGWGFIVVAACLGTIPVLNLGAVLYLTLAVVFDWAWRGWWKQSLAAVLIASISVIVGFEGKYNIIAGLFYAAQQLFAFGAGFLLRRYIDENVRLQLHAVMEKHRNEAAATQMKQQLATELHNYTAGTLSRITSLSAKLVEDAKNDPNASADTVLRLEVLHGESVRALRELRSTIGMLGQNTLASETPVNLVVSLETAKSVAEGFGFDLETDLDPDNVSELSEDTTRLLRECVREALTNLIKYGDPEKPCALTVEIDEAERLVDFTVVNSIGSPGHNPVLSGGNGLVLLSQRLKSAGGTLEAGRTGRRWVLHITVPLTRQEAAHE